MKKRKGTAVEKAKASDARSPRRGSSVVDLETVRELARIATEFDLAEVEADATGRIRVSRAVRTAVAPVAAAPAAAPALTSVASAASAPSAADKGTDAGLVITSPFVGTFYRASSPDAPVFVDVGQVVRKGQVACIVEAMKLMNEIESDYDGKVVAVLVQNGEHVEYGQPLFRIEKA